MTGMQYKYKGLGGLFLITTLLLFYCKARAILSKITVEACSSLNAQHCKPMITPPRDMINLRWPTALSFPVSAARHGRTVSSHTHA